MATYLRTSDGHEIRVGKTKLPIPCFCCGVCCIRYQPPVEPEEFSRIAEYLHLSLAEFQERHIQDTPCGYLLRRTEEGCVFLAWDDTGRAGCTIHAVRPEACRVWMPGLSRRECREGLSRLGGNGLMLLEELYPTAVAAKEFCSSLNGEKEADM